MIEFAKVKEFFISWGLAPGGEEYEDCILGNANGEYTINSACYERMAREAYTMYGAEFRAFVSRVVDATDGEFYIASPTWDELEEAWNKVNE
jgi:hypothetical protein